MLCSCPVVPVGYSGMSGHHGGGAPASLEINTDLSSPPSAGSSVASDQVVGLQPEVAGGVADVHPPVGMSVQPKPGVQQQLSGMRSLKILVSNNTAGSIIGKSGQVGG